MTTKVQREVWITGIGFVSCHGEGAELTWQKLGAGKAPEPIVECEKFHPYCIHPIPELDWSAQITKRGDVRQMENWQRLGTYTAGLALDDAGIKDNAELCSTMDLVVAAGGGERDIEVDNAIMAEAIGHNDREKLILERLPNDLRPTLFLAQLSNLLAGNISIVHKVTGSSRTYMGEETAGVTAIENALARIQSGQSSHLLVGGSYHADRPDAIVPHELGHAIFSGMKKGEGGFAGINERQSGDGGMALGSVGAFLVLEDAEHARARGATPYAKLSGVASDLGRRSDDEATKSRLFEIIEKLGAKAAGTSAVISGASGVSGITNLEFDSLKEALGDDIAIRAHGTQIGQPLEANFPAGVALAALALKNSGFYPPFEDAEKPVSSSPSSILVTAISHGLGEGMALLEKA
ncbi:MAG: beta-ketoacyl-ACP synthase [Rhizobiaceae bacterium]|nr:beta-ketoacyl-ACP synthase [Rhizobiaceae bacterium]